MYCTLRFGVTVLFMFIVILKYPTGGESMNKMSVSLNIVSVGHGSFDDGRFWAKMTVLTSEKSDMEASFGLKMAKYSLVDSDTGKPSVELARRLQDKLATAQKDTPLRVECEAVLVTASGSTSLAVCGLKAA